MWTNENWTRRWDGHDSEILISQDYRPADEELLLADFARHFADPRYIRLGQRPLLMVYRPGLIPRRRGVRALAALLRRAVRRKPDHHHGTGFRRSGPKAL